MDANRPVGQRVVKCLLLSLLMLLAYSQFGCAPTSYYVPVAGDRVEINPGCAKEAVALTTYSAGNERQSCVSPDGKHVALISRPFSKRAGHYNNDVYVIDADNGGNMSPITNAQGEQEMYYPRWVGNDSLLYTRYDGGSNFPRSLYLHDYPPKSLEGYPIIGREQLIVFGNSYVWNCSPSPDGKKVAVCVELPLGRTMRFTRPRPDIFRRQPDLENATILMYDLVTRQARLFASGFDPAWSPDGKSIAYAQKRGDNAHIYVKNVETNKEHTITYGTGADAVDWSPCWSPSGDAIAFTSWRGRDWNIWKVDAEGHNPMQLTVSKGTEWDPSWGPGGNIFFSFFRTGQDWDIWRLQLNPPSGLK